MHQIVKCQRKNSITNLIKALCLKVTLTYLELVTATVSLTSIGGFLKFLKFSKSRRNDWKKVDSISMVSFCVFLMIDKLTGLVPQARFLGILNLIANFSDNIAHGATVVSSKTLGFILISKIFLIFVLIGWCFWNFN